MNAPDTTTSVPVPTVRESRSRGRWALSGLLAGGFGLAAAELFVGLTDGFTSPILSVGDKAIDLVPVPVKTFAIRTFGTHDKQALLFGIFSAIAVFALVVGLVGRTRRWLAVTGLAVFGLVGALAAVTGRTGGASDAIPSLIAAAVAIGAFLLLARALARPRALQAEGAAPTPITQNGGSRRQFLALAGGLAVAGAGIGSFGRMLQNGAGAAARRLALVLPKAKRPLTPLPATAGVPELVQANPFVTPNKSFYRIDTALVVPKVDVDSWSLRIRGMVGLDRTYTYEDLLARD